MTVRVWLTSVDVPDEAMGHCWDILDDGERASAEAFLNPRKRKQFTVAHGVLRILAGRELNTPPAALAWIPGRYGKPELAQPWSQLHTSLSHSAGMIAVAISADRRVGVDIQQLVPRLDVIALARRFYPVAEADYVTSGHDGPARADRFARLWASKEAVVKAAGGRLWPNLRTPVLGREVVECTEPAGPHRVAELQAPLGYRAAVALAGAAPIELLEFRDGLDGRPQLAAGGLQREVEPAGER
jgi:4'-phosphopantetheinyl transferase